MSEKVAIVMAALVAAIDVSLVPKTWMDGSRPSMTALLAEGALT